MTKRPRTARRAEARATRGLVRDRERLAAMAPGGSSARPLRVDSVAVIEPRAAATACPQCDGELAVGEHAAVVVDDVRLRRLDVRCRRCGAPRSLWFVIAPALAN